MKIYLKSISLRNFKGVKELTIDNLSQEVVISGDNATGKTSVFDAWSYLLFGKDSHDRKDFEVKTLNPDGSPIHNLDHEVSACILVDGQERYFKRVLREKWVKKRGEESTELQGHETFFWVNNVPYQAGEFKVKVDEVLPEAVFKLVSSPLYFNSLPWKDRRGILTSIAGEIPQPHGYDFIKEKIKEIGLEVFKREISAKKKLLKDEVIQIPSRIDELVRSSSEPVNVPELSKQIEEALKRVGFLNSHIEEAGKRFNARNQNNLLKQRDIHEMKMKLQGIQMRVEELNRSASYGVTNKIKDIENKLDRYVTEINDMHTEISRKTLAMEIIEKEITALREEWNIENAKTLTISDHDVSCPTCNRPLDDIETRKVEMTTSFNNTKIIALNRINQEGQQKKTALETGKALIADLTAKIEIKNKGLETLKSELKEIRSQPLSARDYTKEPDYIATQKAIQEVVFEEIATEDTSELKSEIQLLQDKVDAARKLLTLNEVNEKNKVRLNDLKDREKELSQLIADLEKTEFQIEGYTRSFITEVENRVNSMFTLVKFRMFNTLLNGGTEEACETLVNGVPFSDANSAAKINAGIDIINTLSLHYKASAPIWIDNREGTNYIIPTSSQIINLVVTNEKVLTVSNN